MAKKEEIPEPAEKPEGETPAEQETSAEQPEPVQEGPGSKEVNKDACMWAMICHLGGLGGLLPIVPAVGCFIAPLIIWQVKKDEDPFIDEQGKEAVNFQISISIYVIVSIMLSFLCIGFFLLAGVIIFDFVFLLIAAVKANDGQYYRYPLAIRFIR